MSDAHDDTASGSASSAMGGSLNSRTTVPPNNSNDGKHVDTPSPYAHLEEGWRYKVPADKGTILVVGTETLYWCRHCKCRKTYKVGLYNKTHTTSKHDGAKRGDMTKAEQDASYPVDPNLKLKSSSSGAASGPAANLSSVSEATVPIDTSKINHVDTDPHGLEFSKVPFLLKSSMKVIVAYGLLQPPTQMVLTSMHPPHLTTFLPLHQRSFSTLWCLGCILMLEVLFIPCAMNVRIFFIRFQTRLPLIVLLVLTRRMRSLILLWSKLAEILWFVLVLVAARLRLIILQSYWRRRASPFKHQMKHIYNQIHYNYI